MQSKHWVVIDLCGNLEELPPSNSNDKNFTQMTHMFDMFNLVSFLCFILEIHNIIIKIKSLLT